MTADKLIADMFTSALSWRHWNSGISDHLEIMNMQITPHNIRGSPREGRLPSLLAAFLSVRPPVHTTGRTVGANLYQFSTTIRQIITVSNYTDGCTLNWEENESRFCKYRVMQERPRKVWLRGNSIAQTRLASSKAALKARGALRARVTSAAHLERTKSA